MYGKTEFLLLRFSRTKFSTAKENFTALVRGLDSNSMLIVVHCSSASGQLDVSDKYFKP